MIESEEAKKNDRILSPADLDDDEALKEYGRQLAMDSLLSELESTEGTQNMISLADKNWTRRAWISASAACLAGLAGFSIWRIGKNDSFDGSQLGLLDPSWMLQAMSDAEFQVLSPNHLKLFRGELRLTSHELTELLVETPYARVTAKGSDFLIGQHDPTTTNNKTNRTNDMKMKTMTRLLVLAGSVTLANGKGAEAANANEAIIAKANERPEKILVDANSQFAFDCYARLTSADADANVFFSPYSISNALLMVAEGARGETAQEMGKVLGFPESLQRTGDDAQLIPWEMSKLRAGQSRINALLRSGDTLSPEQVRLRKKETALLAQWEELKAKIAKIKGGDHKARFRLEDDEWILVYNLNQVRKQMDTLTLRIANAVWGERTMHFLEPWKKTVSGSYGVGVVEKADFLNNHDAERKRINAWVEAQTEGRITGLFPEGTLTQETRLVLTNAIYFKGDWLDPFPKGRTTEADFFLQSGETAKMQLMKKDEDESVRYAAFNSDGSRFETPKWDRGEGKAKYPGKDGFSMIELPYRGDSVSMVVIAPNDPTGLPALEKRLNAESVSKWIASLNNRKTNIRLPKFKMESRYDLNETLAAMGMPSAFSPERANFSGISSSKEIFIGAVSHKAFIEVTEEGTEAAAASGIRVKQAIEPFVPTFTADRPFIYLIRDKKSGTVLFLGRILKPTI